MGGGPRSDAGIARHTKDRRAGSRQSPSGEWGRKGPTPHPGPQGTRNPTRLNGTFGHGGRASAPRGPGAPDRQKGACWTAQPLRAPGRYVETGEDRRRTTGPLFLSFLASSCFARNDLFVERSQDGNLRLSPAGLRIPCDESG